ncbi:MAG: DUF1631 family protein [Halioglobus sp.]
MMPEAQTLVSSLPATLELEESVRIKGDLSLSGEGTLKLSAIKIIDPQGSKSKLSQLVFLGKAAILNLGALRDKLGFIDNLDIIVTEILGTEVLLHFAQPAGSLERRCLALLPDHRKDSDMTTGNIDQDTDRGKMPLQLFQEQSITQMETLLKRFLVDLCNHLLDLSGRSKQITSGENIHYEAMNAIKKNGMAILNAITQTLNTYYQTLDSNAGADSPALTPEPGGQKLDLVDLKEFEEDLVISKIIKTGEDLYGVPLECLTLRLADLIDADPHLLRVPVGITQLCNAFHQGVVGRGIPEPAMGDIVDYFDRHLIRELQDYYEDLNALLRERGIRPELEEEILSNGSLLNRPSPIKKSVEKKPTAKEKTKEKPPSSTAENGPNLDQIATQKATEFADSLIEKLNDRFSPDNLYQSVIDALNFKREADNVLVSDSHGIAPGQPGAQVHQDKGITGGASNKPLKLTEPGSIANILGQMQQDSAFRNAVQESPSLREYLANNQGQINGLEDSQGLSPQSLNQLDLIDNMFGSIKSQMDVTAGMKPVLGDLQIPMARLALLEPQFFVDKSHAARGVMDKLAQLAASANFPNKVLEGRIAHIIDNIVTNYDNDSAIFESALSEVEILVDKQERAITRNVDRVVRTQEGNEKLKQAQLAVKKELSTRVVPPTAPAVLMDLIDSGWRDLLILTHIKEGPDSAAWKEQIKTLDILSQWLDEQCEGGLDEDLLMQRSTEAEPLIDLIDQQISTALPTSVVHESVLENLRDIFSGRRSVLIREVTEADEDIPAAALATRAKIENLPRLRRWIRRVEELKKGTWLTYKDKSGQKRRMQLAWVSDDKNRYIFVNERGQKNADLSSVQLARHLGRGVQPPPPSEKLSLVDRSMFDTLEHVQKSLSFDKNHDSLTKLINKRTFVDQLERALKHAQRKSSQHAVLNLNIDQFSLVNEVYDRVSGDQVLTEFARLLAQLHGRKSSSARLQNDEFAVLLLDRDIDQAQRYAEKIRSDIEASSVEIEGEKVTFTVSIGIAPVRVYSPSVESILECAHVAMRKAKTLGRNRVVVFEEDKKQSDDYQAQQALIEADIKHTIETDLFVLRGQPIVQTQLGSDSTTSQHYEILLTITEPDGSLKSPTEFIENAERFGYMTLVDRWVVKEAFEWISRLIDDQKVVPSISINLSGNSVTDDAFMEYLLEQISEYGVGTNRLCFEITETGTISNLVKAADFVRTFRNIGCKFSIDDFGTGLASHNYLRELPVDFVKIDGTFITGIHENRTDYAMARSINDLAHFLGQETIAESVENDAIIDCLQEIGVDYLQGWGVGKPKLLTQITDELSSIEK